MNKIFSFSIICFQVVEFILYLLWQEGCNLSCIITTTSEKLKSNTYVDNAYLVVSAIQKKEKEHLFFSARTCTFKNKSNKNKKVKKNFFFSERNKNEQSNCLPFFRTVDFSTIGVLTIFLSLFFLPLLLSRYFTVHSVFTIWFFYHFLTIDFSFPFDKKLYIYHWLKKWKSDQCLFDTLCWFLKTEILKTTSSS